MGVGILGLRTGEKAWLLGLLSSPCSSLDGHEHDTSLSCAFIPLL